MAKKVVVEEVVFTKEDFEKVVTELGTFLGEEITIEGEREECVEEFLNLVGGISDALAKDLPDCVFTMNNALIDKGADILVWEAAEEVVEETQGEEVQEKEVQEAEAPAPKKKDGRGRPKGSTKNKEVKKEEKVMAKKVEEVKVVEKKVVAPVKKEVVAPAKKLVEKKVAAPAKEKVAKAPKTKAELGRYGHRKGSSADFMDEMIWKGCTLDEAVASIVKGLSKTKERAKGMFLAHIYYLPNKKNIPIDKPKAEGGKYKAKKANTDI